MQSNSNRGCAFAEQLQWRGHEFFKKSSLIETKKQIFINFPNYQNQISCFSAKNKSDYSQGRGEQKFNQQQVKQSYLASQQKDYQKFPNLSSWLKNPQNSDQNYSYLNRGELKCNQQQACLIPEQISREQQKFSYLVAGLQNPLLETIENSNQQEQKKTQNKVQDGTENSIFSNSTNTDQKPKDLDEETDNREIHFDIPNKSEIQCEVNQDDSDDSEQMPEKIPEDIPLCLLLGQAGNGKTYLMNKIFNTNQEMELFKPQLLWKKQIKYYFVDTSSFDFDSDYDQREEQINDYKELFKSFPNRIRSILVVINFERTDLMKKKGLAILKYFNKFQNLISLAITNFHLSQNVEGDKKHLRDSFKFLQAKDIIFIEKNTQQKEILNSLKENSLKSLERSYKFDLSDTLFEDEDEEEQMQIMSELEKRFNK